MSRNWLGKLVLVIAFGLSIGIGSRAFVADGLSAKEEQKNRPKTPPPIRLGVANVANILKQFNHANQQGLSISKRRQYYVDLVKPLRDRLADLKKKFDVAPDAAESIGIREKMSKLNGAIEDIDKESQKELTEMSDRVIVDVYHQIQAACAELAKERGLDAVLVYPDGSTERDNSKPAVAQLKLQTPALTPFYLSPELDFTQEIVDRLNKKHPAHPIDN